MNNLNIFSFSINQILVCCFPQKDEKFLQDELLQRGSQNKQKKNREKRNII